MSARSGGGDRGDRGGGGGGGGGGAGRSRTLAPLVATGALQAGVNFLSCSVAGREHFAGEFADEDRESRLVVVKSRKRVPRARSTAVFAFWLMCRESERGGVAARPDDVPTASIEIVEKPCPPRGKVFRGALKPDFTILAIANVVALV